MKTFFFLIFVFLLVGCTPFGSTFGKNEPLDETLIQGLRCVDVGPHRGVVVQFVPEAPPSGEITEDQRFPVTLKFANYQPGPVSVSYRVFDTSAYGGDDTKGYMGGFRDAVGSVTVEAAEYKDSYTPGGILQRSFLRPGCFLLEEQHPELDFGFVSYSGIPHDDTLHYAATITYDATSFAYGSFCVFNPSFGESVGCSRVETFSAAQLGDQAPRDPVSIISVQKKLVGSKVTLDISFENLGKGSILTKKRETVGFTFLSRDIGFQCTSPTAFDGSGGITFPVSLDVHGKGFVTCSAEISASAPEKHTFEIILTYPYSYTTLTQDLIVRKQLTTGY